MQPAKQISRFQKKDNKNEIKFFCFSLCGFEDEYLYNHQQSEVEIKKTQWVKNLSLEELANMAASGRQFSCEQDLLGMTNIRMVQASHTPQWCGGSSRLFGELYKYGFDSSGKGGTGASPSTHSYP